MPKKSSLYHYRWREANLEKAQETARNLARARRARVRVRKMAFEQVMSELQENKLKRSAYIETK